MPERFFLTGSQSFSLCARNVSQHLVVNVFTYTSFTVLNDLKTKRANTEITTSLVITGYLRIPNTHGLTH